MNEPILPAPVAGFISAVNDGDEALFLAAFADDGVVDDWGTLYAGPAAIKQWSDREFLGTHGTLTPESCSVDGRTVSVVGDWRSSFANGRSLFRFELDGDRITSMTIREG